MTEPAKIQIEIWPIEKVVPYEKNAKKHPQSQITALAKLIKENGFSAPIVVDKDGVVITGHGRRLASIQLGYKKIPVIVRRDLNDEQVKALRLSDNKIVSTEYDTDLLQQELAALNAAGFDMDLTGFGGPELDFLIADIGEIDDSAFVDDISGAVETQKEENAKTAAAVDESEQPLSKAFGFSKITVGDSRRIKAFMTHCETETGKTGAEALMRFLDELGIE